LPVVWPSFHTACDRRIEVLLLRAQTTVLDRSTALDDAGDRGGPTLDRLLEGNPHERARCLRGISDRKEIPKERACPPELSVSFAERDSKPQFPAIKDFETRVGYLFGVIREIDIWRVAVFMLKRYADDAEANADRRAEELETEGDHAGAAIWRRVTFAIEQLIDTTGLLH
jgi:hypothetical protein